MIFDPGNIPNSNHPVTRTATVRNRARDVIKGDAVLTFGPRG